MSEYIFVTNIFEYSNIFVTLCKEPSVIVHSDMRQQERGIYPHMRQHTREMGVTIGNISHTAQSERKRKGSHSLHLHHAACCCRDLWEQQEREAILCIYAPCHAACFCCRALWQQTSQELRMLSSVTINCQITKIVMNSGSQLSEL